MKFDKCEICGSIKWTLVYNGKIRDGIFGNFDEKAEVKKCGNCKVQRLCEDKCIGISSYKDSSYRKKLSKGIDVESFYAEQDIQQIFTLNTLWPRSIRDKNVMDVGAGGGSLLDYLRGFTENQIAIEPYENYHLSLSNRGYTVFNSLKNVKDKWKEQIDCAFAIQVIEHTSNPKLFLQQINPLLKKNGILILSTPNADDILLDILPNHYTSFFYRVVHRWYFNTESLVFCAKAAGYNVEQVKPVHRYSMSNMMNWLMNKKPMGNISIKNINKSIDDSWKSYLEETGKSDCLYLILSKQ